MKGNKMQEKWIETDRPEFQKWIFLAPTACFPLLHFLNFCWLPSCLRKQNMFPFLLYASPTNWSIRALQCPQRDSRAENAFPVGSSGHTLSAGCALSTLARDSCLPMWLLVLSGQLGLSGYDSLSKEVALNATLLIIHPLPCLCYNSTLHKIQQKLL